MIKSGVELICIECGKTFYVKPCRKDSAKFCSNHCKYKGQSKLLRKYTLEKSVLEDLYIKRGLSSLEMEKMIGVSSNVILQRLRECGIAVRTVSEALLLKNGKEYPTKEEIKDAYYGNEWSLKKVGRQFNISEETVRSLLDKYCIPVKTKGWRLKLDRPRNEEMERLYLEEKKSTHEIADILKMSDVSVGTILKEYNIPIRSGSEAHKVLYQTTDVLKHWLKSINTKPNIPERTVLGVIEKHNLPYRYTGDGDVIIGGKCPDFFNTNGNKIVIEVFGRAFHSPLFTFKKKMPYHQTYKGTIEHYKKYGLKCIVLWDRDIMREDGEDFVLNAIQKMGGM